MAVPLTDDVDPARVLCLLSEGALYEGLLSCGSRVAPVGLVRRGGELRVRLFPGRLREALSAAGEGAVHLTNDPRLLLKALEGGLEPVLMGTVPRLEGCFASVLVRVAGREAGRVEDGLGAAEVEHLVLRPVRAILEPAGPRPLCRGDGQLLEALVHATRARGGRGTASGPRRAERERAEEALGVVVRTLPDGEALARRVRALMGGG